MEVKHLTGQAMQSIDDIVENFLFLDDWNERYRYLIELGRELEPLPAEAHNEDNRVRGCASQVWLETKTKTVDGAPVLLFRGDSDAFIVKGLIYLALALYHGKAAAEIERTDASELFKRLGLGDHLTPQRSNGFRAMVERIKNDARRAMNDLASPAMMATSASR